MTQLNYLKKSFFTTLIIFAIGSMSSFYKYRKHQRQAQTQKGRSWDTAAKDEAMSAPVVDGRKVAKISKKLDKIQEKQGLDKTNSGDNQVLALVLAFFLGGLGIHRFVVGYTWQGVVQLLTAGAMWYLGTH